MMRKTNQLCCGAVGGVEARYVELALVGGHEVERDDALVGLLVREGHVSVAERAAAHILAAQAHIVLCCVSLWSDGGGHDTPGRGQ